MLSGGRWSDNRRREHGGCVLYWITLRQQLEGEETMARIEVKSEITGTVWQIKSAVGDKVESGDTLVVIESMKMEIPVITEDAGVVKEILVKEKDPVAEGQVVAILED